MIHYYFVDILQRHASIEFSFFYYLSHYYISINIVNASIKISLFSSIKYQPLDELIWPGYLIISFLRSIQKKETSNLETLLILCSFFPNRMINTTDVIVEVLVAIPIFIKRKKSFRQTLARRLN